jgi:hypothetical protein
LTASDGVNHGVMFGVGIVDEACAAKSEVREELRGTPTSRCRAGRSIVAPETRPHRFLTAWCAHRAAGPIRQ